MKASIKLMTAEAVTISGFPVYVKLADGRKRVKKCVCHSFVEDWDAHNQVPYKHHPLYFDVLPKVLEYHARVVKINFGSYTFEMAKDFLLPESKKKSDLFSDAALRFCGPDKTGSVYKTVLNSWNGFFPCVLVSEITPKMANEYMKHLLNINKPNGVHAYLTKLTALFTKISDAPNPFKGIRPRKVKTPQKQLTETDLIKLTTTRTIVARNDFKNTPDTVNRYRYYWLLMFYLGGIDFVDLANMRYDKHVVNGRIQFYRNKGGTNAFVNNLIPPAATEILKLFSCFPYLVPIYKTTNADDFRNNMNKRFNETVLDLGLTQRPLTKSARYTFINRARQLMVDERITMEIVGHQQQTVHSIYTDNYPLHIRDAAHLKIILLPVVF
jgi:hypothetical protein